MVEKILHQEEMLAIIISGRFREPGIHFFTPNDLSQQLAFMKHPKGKVIVPHVHQPVAREVIYTQETLVIKKGKLRVDFFDQDQNYLQSRELIEGDVILLIKGGHGFEVLEDLEMLEIKQGPFVGESDKKRFSYPNNFKPHQK